MNSCPTARAMAELIAARRLGDRGQLLRDLTEKFPQATAAEIQAAINYSDRPRLTLSRRDGERSCP